MWLRITLPHCCQFKLFMLSWMDEGMHTLLILSVECAYHHPPNNNLVPHDVVNGEGMHGSQAVDVQPFQIIDRCEEDSKEHS